MTQHRACFDFRISFSNGGTLTGTGFRLDLPGSDASTAEVGELLVHDLGLTMVGAIELAGLRIVEEPHRGMPRAPAAGPASRQRVELSHPIRHGMTTYPGMPGPEITEHLTREAAEAMYGPGIRFHIGRISMVANTGTYLDSPFHRFDDGVDLAALALERFAALDGIVIRVAGADRRPIDVHELAPYDVTGRAVLLHTGWERHWETPGYGIDAPYLTRAATAWLVEHGAALVGIDAVNIDDMADRSRPAHTGLLGAGIPIVEHMCGWDQLPVTGFQFHAAPPRIERFGTFPVRAYAVIG